MDEEGQLYTFSIPFLVLSLSHVQLIGDPMDYSPLGFSAHWISRQEDWGGLPFPSPGIFPTQGLKQVSLLGRLILYH